MGIDSLWRQKLAQELERAGGPTELAAELAARTPKGETIWSPNFLTQLQDPAKSFGKKLAAKFEARAGRPPGWMNVPIDAPERAVNPDRQSANDVFALQMAVQSLVHAMTSTMPAAAPTFVAHLDARVKSERFSDQRGIVASVLAIARQVQSRAEAAGLLPEPLGSALKSKQGKQGRRG
jgi:hypothetical protein